MGTHVMALVRDAIRRIRGDGWFLTRTKESHRQFRHPLKKGTVTIAERPGDDLPRGTGLSIMKHAGLRGPR